MAFLTLLRAWSDGQVLATTSGVPVDVAPSLLPPGIEGSEIVAARAGTVKNLFARIQQAPAGIESITCTLHVDGVLTSLSAVITGAALEASDTTHKVVVAKGQKLTVKVTISISALNPKAIRVDTEFA